MKKFYILMLVCISSLAKAQNITVTSLADDGSTGTLRWAIGQANSNSDASIIDFDNSLNGTITLTSNLPNISADLTILGSGRSKITISGDNQYKMFYVIGGGKNFNISSVTLTKGGSFADEGASMIYVSDATALADDILVKENTNNVAFNSRASGSYLTITNSEFSNNSGLLLHNDHGSTPATTSPESSYDNRLIITNTKFLNNTGEIFWTERYVKIDGCEFIGNSSGGANRIGRFNGVNRFQILNSTFKNNIGNLFEYSSWLSNNDINGSNQILWSTSLSENNFLFDNNIFEGNTGIVINSDNTYDQSKTTIINNIFINNGTNWVGNPIVISQNKFDNFFTSISVDMTQSLVTINTRSPVYGALNSSSQIDVNDIQLEVSGGTATLGSTKPTNLTVRGNVINFEIQINGIINGAEVLKVIPVINSIYDEFNNIAYSIQKVNTAYLDYKDEDNDGVVDVLDQCPNTPNSVFVDPATGCTDLSKGVIWRGPSITFKKENYADYTLPANQDYITDNVIITRANELGIFNIAVEPGYDLSSNLYPSPSKTLWAKIESNNLTPNQIQELFFQPWGEAVKWKAGNQINNYFMVYLPEEKIYFSVKILSWTSGGLGGGFSYQRSTCNDAPVINSFSPQTGVAGTQITISGSAFENVTAISIGGIPVDSFTIDSPTQITAIVAEGSSGKIQLTSGCSTFSQMSFTIPGENCYNAINLANQTSPIVVNTADFKTKDFINDNDFDSGNRSDAFFYIDVPSGKNVSLKLSGVGYFNDWLSYRLRLGGTCVGENLVSTADPLVEYWIYLGEDQSGAIEGYSNTYRFLNNSDTTQRYYIITNGYGSEMTFSLSWSIFDSASANKVIISGTNQVDEVPNNTVTVIDSNINVSSDGTIDGAKVQITGGYVSGASGDILDIEGDLPAGITSSYDDSRGLLSFDGIADASVWQSVLRKVTIKSTNQTCYPEQRLITFNLGNKYYNPLTGHWYEYETNPKTWVNAKLDAANRTYFGKVGYLATVTSQAENNFIWKIMDSDAWLGGSDHHEEVNQALGRTVYPDKNSIEGNFFWVTGPESGTQFSSGNSPSLVTIEGQYSNWHNGEPNDNAQTQDEIGESVVQFYSENDGTWNDLRRNDHKLGYLIEYGGLNGDDNSSIINFTREIKVNGSTSGSISGGGVNVCSGTNSTVLTLSGHTGSVVRWEYSYDNFYTGGIHINNQTSTFTAEDISKTTYFRAVTTCDGNEINTASINITVNKVVPGNITSDNNTICEGGTVKLTLSGKQGDVLKWQVSDDNENSWINISNTNTELTRVLSVQGIYSFRAVVKIDNCGSEVYSSSYQIEVLSGIPPVGGSVSSEVYNTAGNKSGTLTLSGHTGTVSKWQFSKNNGLIWNDIDNSTSATLEYSGVNTNTLYRAILSNGNCGITLSSVGTIVFIYQPTGISLNSSNVNENNQIGSIVANLSSIDLTNGDSHSYTLVAGDGDDDNVSFEIVGNSLKSKIAFDYEVKSSYSVRIRTTDASNLSFEQSLIITVDNVDEVPTSIILSTNKLNENNQIGSLVANLDVNDSDQSDTHTFELVAGNGDSDNTDFEIIGNELKSKIVFDFESKATYSIRVLVKDSSNLTFEDSFQITVKDLNEAPKSIILSANNIDERSPIGSVVGLLSSIDLDANDSHNFILTSGDGDTDNSSFEIVSGELKTKEVFDFDKKTAYSIRIRCTDTGLLSFEDSLLITINNLNAPPTDINLSSNSVLEKSSIGTIVANLSSTDLDAGDTHSYLLVSGVGDADNSSFEIVSGQLRTKEVFNFKNKSSYSVRIRSTDSGSSSFEDSFTILINSINSDPTGITLSSNSINENSAIGTALAILSSLDVDTNDSHTYTFVSGSGDTDNAKFEIVGNELKVKEVFDFEKDSTYSVRIRTTDAGSLSFEDTFTIIVKNLNESPTAMSVSADSINENSAIGTVLANLSSIDEDAYDTHTYILVSGSGDADNAKFEIVGNEIKSKEVFDFEKKSSYSIRIRTTDAGALSFEDTFTITVKDVNDAPTDIVLSGNSINENTAVGTVLATLTSKDVDANDTHNYALVSGSGDTNNANFEIVGNELKVKEVFDFEKKTSYSIRIRTTDAGGLSYEKAFTITIKDVNEVPAYLALSKQNIYEQNSVDDLIGLLSTTDQDAGDAHTYTLVSGTGSTDNAAFKIVNGQLRAAQSFKFATKNEYSVRIRTTDKGGLSAEQAFSITISEKPVITGTGNETYPFTRTAASANPSISLGYTSNLNVNGSDIVSYNWINTTGLSASTISNPEAKPKTTTTYSVEVTNRFGSKTTVSITVTVREDYNIKPSNIITPNGDGVNDFWTIENLESYPNNKVSIFDRSGRVIYSKANYMNDWNGQLNGSELPEGTYYYIISIDGGKGEKRGFITIIR